MNDAAPDGPPLAGAQVAVPLADLRAAPCADAELLNQAFLATPLLLLDESADAAGERWRRVRLPDYLGWMRAADLLDAPPPAGACRVRVAALTTLLHLPDGATLPVCAGTTLPVASGARPSGRCVVALPDGRQALVAAEAVLPAGSSYRGTLAAVLVTARAFLGTPYLWGGMTWRGIDCSGLTQISYSVHGYTLPRDADQQYRLPHAVAPGVWAPGDLIFFGAAPDTVTHVMLYLGDEQVIHAKGGAQVVIESLNPARPDYHARADQYLGARRVILTAPDEE